MESCGACGKAVYPMEKTIIDGTPLHKLCFRCEECHNTLRLANYASLKGKYYCKPHFKQLFRLKGNYDEGFGHEQHKRKWQAGSSHMEGSDDEEDTQSDNPERRYSHSSVSSTATDSATSINRSSSMSHPVSNRPATTIIPQPVNRVSSNVSDTAEPSLESGVAAPWAVKLRKVDTPLSATQSSTSLEMDDDEKPVEAPWSVKLRHSTYSISTASAEAISAPTSFKRPVTAMTTSNTNNNSSSSSSVQPPAPKATPVLSAPAPILGEEQSLADILQEEDDYDPFADDMFVTNAPSSITNTGTPLATPAKHGSFAAAFGGPETGKSVGGFSTAPVGSLLSDDLIQSALDFDETDADFLDRFGDDPVLTGTAATTILASSLSSSQSLHPVMSDRLALDDLAAADEDDDDILGAPTASNFLSDITSSIVDPVKPLASAPTAVVEPTVSQTFPVESHPTPAPELPQPVISNAAEVGVSLGADQSGTTVKALASESNFVQPPGTSKTEESSFSVTKPAGISAVAPGFSQPSSVTKPIESLKPASSEPQPLSLPKAAEVVVVSESASVPKLAEKSILAPSVVFSQPPSFSKPAEAVVISAPAPAAASTSAHAPAAVRTADLSSELSFALPTSMTKLGSAAAPISVIAPASVVVSTQLPSHGKTSESVVESASASAPAPTPAFPQPSSLSKPAEPFALPTATYSQPPLSTNFIESNASTQANPSALPVSAPALASSTASAKPAEPVVLTAVTFSQPSSSSNHVEPSTGPAAAPAFASASVLAQPASAKLAEPVVSTASTPTVVQPQSITSIAESTLQPPMARPIESVIPTVRSSNENAPAPAEAMLPASDVTRQADPIVVVKPVEASVPAPASSRPIAPIFYEMPKPPRLSNMDFVSRADNFSQSPSVSTPSSRETSNPGTPAPASLAPHFVLPATVNGDHVQPPSPAKQSALVGMSPGHATRSAAPPVTSSTQASVSAGPPGTVAAPLKPSAAALAALASLNKGVQAQEQEYSKRERKNSAVEASRGRIGSSSDQDTKDKGGRNRKNSQNEDGRDRKGSASDNEPQRDRKTSLSRQSIPVNNTPVAAEVIRNAPAPPTSTVAPVNRTPVAYELPKARPNLGGVNKPVVNKPVKVDPSLKRTRVLLQPTAFGNNKTAMNAEERNLEKDSTSSSFHLDYLGTREVTRRLMDRSVQTVNLLGEESAANSLIRDPFTMVVSAQKLSLLNRENRALIVGYPLLELQYCAIDRTDDMVFGFAVLPASDSDKVLLHIFESVRPGREITGIISTARNQLTRTAESGSSNVSTQVNSDKKAIANMVTHLQNSQTMKSAPLMRRQDLVRVGEVMCDPKMHREAGYPAVINCADRHLLIGTSHSMVLVFDWHQQFCLSFGGHSFHGQYGAITAMCSLVDSNSLKGRVLTGHSSGRVLLWDLPSGKLLKASGENVHVGSVINMVFSDASTAAVPSVIATDSAGSLCTHMFKRVVSVWTCDSKCLMTANVCNAASLPAPVGCVHSSSVNNLLAVVTADRVRLIELRPKAEVVAMFKIETMNFAVLPSLTDPLLADAMADGEVVTNDGLSTVPIRDAASHLNANASSATSKIPIVPTLAWRAACIDPADRAVILNPVLCVCWGEKMLAIQVTTDHKYLCGMAVIIPERVSAIRWLTHRTFALLTMDHKLTVMDLFSGTRLETIDLTDTQLQYLRVETPAGLSSIIPTPPSMDKSVNLGLRSYQPVLANGSRCHCYLLGSGTVVSLSLCSWSERVTHFVRDGHYLEAINMAMSFYQGSALGVTGLSEDPAQRKQIVRDEVADLLLAYVDVSMKEASDGKHSDLHQFFTTLAMICMDRCLITESTSLLFGEIFERFTTDAEATSCFLESLVPFIMSDRLTTLSPSILKQFIEYHEAVGELKMVERCLVRMDVRNLDLHQMITLCRRHELFTALIYVFTRGMQDFVMPILELLDYISQRLALLPERLRSGELLIGDAVVTEEEKAVGYKLLLFLSYSLSGRAYPTGVLPASMVSRVKSDVYLCLFSRSVMRDSLRRPSLNGSVINANASTLYPYLEILVRFDTKEFLNVLSLGFEDPLLDSSNAMQHSLLDRQTIVDILLDATIPGGTQGYSQDDGSTISGTLLSGHGLAGKFTDEQMGAIYCFIGRQLARYPQHISLARLTFQNIFRHLTCSTDLETRDDRQDVVLDLYNAGLLNDWNEEMLLSMAERAHFYQVLELLYGRKHRYDKILICYLRDETMRRKSLAFVHRVLTEENFSEQDRLQIRQLAVKNAKELVCSEPRVAARMILADMPADLPDLIQGLESYPDLLYPFLNGVFEGSPQGFEGAANKYAVPREVHDRYIALMAEHEPTRVYNYLKNTDNFDLKACLDACTKFLVSDAMALLMEQLGDITGAFALVLENLLVRIGDLHKAYHESGDTRRALNKTRSILDVAIGLCQRNVSRLSEDDREKLWFQLLDAFVDAQQQLKQEEHTEPAVTGLSTAYRSLANVVLTNMTGAVSIKSTMSHVLQNNDVSGTLGDIKDLIYGMLDTYNYEAMLLSTTNSILRRDLYRSTRFLRWHRSRGLKKRLPNNLPNGSLAFDLLVGAPAPAKADVSTRQAENNAALEKKEKEKFDPVTRLLEQQARLNNKHATMKVFEELNREQDITFGYNKKNIFSEVNESAKYELVKLVTSPQGLKEERSAMERPGPRIPGALPATASIERDLYLPIGRQADDDYYFDQSGYDLT